MFLRFFKEHWDSILFVFLLIIVYIIYISLTDVVQFKRRKDMVIESMQSKIEEQRKKELEEQCNPLSRNNCGCQGSCGWLTLPDQKGRCVAGNSKGPYYHSDSLKPGQSTVNQYYPMNSYEFLSCGK